MGIISNFIGSLYKWLLPPPKQLEDGNDGKGHPDKMVADVTSKSHLPSIYNILLIGETGSGKSTLINYLTNYFNNGSPEEPKIAIPTKHYKETEKYQSSEKDLYDATKSKTSECATYGFTKDNRRYNFIDTPGLSDTEGTERDDLHISKIMTAAEGTGYMTAIILVMNGTVARQTVNLRNTLTRLRGSVPDTLLNNLIVVLTNCSENSANFEFESLKPWTVSQENVFYMNNSALSKSKNWWINNRRKKSGVLRDWEASMEEINNMILRVKDLSTVAANAFGKMRQKRDKIKSVITGILLEVKKLQDTQNNLNSAKEAHKEVTENVEKYSKYKQNEEVEYVEMEKTEYHNTICMHHTDKACHERCSLSFTADVESDIFKGCACMNGSANCLVCGCGPATHYHANEKPVKKTKSVEKILHEMKSLYDENTNQDTRLRDEITKWSTDIEALGNVLKQKESEICECCQELKEICSQFNFVDELSSVIDTMKANARALTSMEVRDKAEDMIRNITHLADKLSMK